MKFCWLFKNLWFLKVSQISVALLTILASILSKTFLFSKIFTKYFAQLNFIPLHIFWNIPIKKYSKGFVVGHWKCSYPASTILFLNCPYILYKNDNLWNGNRRKMLFLLSNNCILQIEQSIVVYCLLKCSVILVSGVQQMLLKQDSIVNIKYSITIWPIDKIFAVKHSWFILLKKNTFLLYLDFNFLAV